MVELNYVTSRLGDVKDATRKIAAEVFQQAQKAGHEVWFIWGMGTSAEHSTGRALDFMVRNAAGGKWVRDYLWNNRQRLRLHHVIWDQHITSTTVRPGVVVKMEDRGNPTANHKDHVHSLHFDGSYQAPTAGTTPQRKSVETLAREVLQGFWGNGDVRKNRLTQAGYDYNAVQRQVNRLIAGQPTKTVQVLANEVIQGDWGNGDERKRRLSAAGYDYNAIQREVNRRLGFK